MARGGRGRLWGVILAGGSGTRFWPESREARPKQFLPLLGSKTLLEQTALRLRPLIPRRSVWVITRADKVALVPRSLGIPGTQVLGEPVGRNTAPCAAVAAALILKRDPEAVLALLPADHRIGNAPLFRRLLGTAADVARAQGWPVTFGIKPDRPHTGFGYLEMGSRLMRRAGFDIHRLKAFHEKPSLRRARAFLRRRNFLWNSGIFVWRADELLRETRRHLPAVWRYATQIAERDFANRLERFFPKMPSISIDHGLMEKMKGRILAIPAGIDWSDLGGWPSLERFFPTDPQRNVTFGKTLLVDSKGNLVKSDRRLIAMLGVENLVVVDTPDALLICPKQRTEGIRKIVSTLKQKKWHQYV